MEEQLQSYTDSGGNIIWYLPSNGTALKQADGTKEWWANNKRHRLDGPAVESDYEEWWIDGTQLPKKEVEDWLEENTVDLKTEAGQMAFKLRWM